jgi:Ca-activated chloride channel family protein
VNIEPRHAVPARPRPHRRHARNALVAGTALALAAGGVVLAQVVRASDDCAADRPVLEVAASPDVAGVVTRIADGVHDPRGCPAVRVRAEAGPDVLSTLGPSSSRAPDVWIPDSSLWIGRARDEKLLPPARQESFGSSPLVVALPRALRDGLAHRDATGQWQDLVSAVAAGQVPVRLPDDAASPSTVGLLAAFKAAADQQTDPRATLTGLLRGTQVQATPGGDDAALATLRDTAQGGLPVPEQAVFQDTGTPGAAPIAAVYPQVAGTPFDYPFTVLTPGARQEVIADHLLSALRSADGQAMVREAGFRGVDGAGAGLTAERGVDGTQRGTVSVPDPATTEELRTALEAVHRDARLLAVIDVSGSMADPAPGSPGSSRLDLALRAAAAGMELYPATTEVGLWAFSEDMSGSSDHQELVPMAPLSAPAPGGRQALALAMAQTRPVPDGGTGLYDTTLAAVRAVRAGWDPARVNAVVLLTDGDDTDADGIGLDQLLATLRSEQASSGQPVPVISIAYGDSAGAQSLAAISAATGGATYQSSDPGRIRDVFLDAVSQRACRPECPTATGN